jgi:hypothetical protein
LAAIKAHDIGTGHFALLRAMTDFMETKRIQYDSTEEFGSDFRRRYRIADCVQRAYHFV